MSTKNSKKGNRYTPKLKFQVALEVLEGKDIGQVSRAYGVHPTTIGHWKRKVVESGPELFSVRSTVRQYEKRIAQLEQLVGKKEIEIAFLKNFLGQIN
jgi:transposase